MNKKESLKKIRMESNHLDIPLWYDNKYPKITKEIKMKRKDENEMNIIFGKQKIPRIWQKSTQD
jgi:hypothetical protein